jgi:hypothetical protein
VTRFRLPREQLLVPQQPSSLRNPHLLVMLVPENKSSTPTALPATPADKM